MDDADATATPTPTDTATPADPGSTDTPTPTPTPTETPAPQPTVIVNVPDGTDYTTQLDGIHNDTQVGVALLLVLSCIVAVAVGAYLARLAWGKSS